MLLEMHLFQSQDIDSTPFLGHIALFFMVSRLVFTGLIAGNFQFFLRMQDPARHQESLHLSCVVFLCDSQRHSIPRQQNLHLKNIKKNEPLAKAVVFLRAACIPTFKTGMESMSNIVTTFIFLPQQL